MADRHMCPKMRQSYAREEKLQVTQWYWNNGQNLLPDLQEVEKFCYWTPSSSSNFTGYSSIVLDKVPNKVWNFMKNMANYSLIFHYYSNNETICCIVCFLFQTKNFTYNRSPNTLINIYDDHESHYLNVVNPWQRCPMFNMAIKRICLTNDMIMKKTFLWIL